MIVRSRSFILIAFLLLVQAIALSAAWSQVAGVTETRLDNGLTVLMKESHAAPVMTAQVWFNVGSRNEHTGITGISHFLEHMLFGTSKNFKKGEITDMVRERGGIDNAATWTDFTYYWVLLSSDHLEFALESLAERLGNALLLSEEIEKERTVVLSEMEGHENNPDRLLYYAIMSAAFTAHPYQWPTIGLRSDVENISRDQLSDYYRTYYHPNNATLVLAGDFDSTQALELVKKHFGPLPAGKQPQPVYTKEPEQRGERRVLVRREGNAERIIIGYHVPGLENSDTYALVVLDQILSGGRSSRLHQALVETQLAGNVWSSAGARKDPSLFMLGAVGRQGVSADDLEKALLEQAEEAKSKLPTDQELQAAKNQLEAYFIFQNDSVSDQGEQLGYYNTVASWKYLETLITKIKAVTAEEVQTVAAKYLRQDNMTVAKFVPTNGSPAGDGGGPAIGPIHKSIIPDESAGVVNYTSAQAEPAAQPTKKLVTPHRVALDNGMVVIVQENPSNPTIAISGNIKAGSYFDPKGKNGVAELTADMLKRGTRKRSSLDIAREVEFVGADLSVEAGVESASFNAKSLSKDAGLILDILSDQLRNPSFPADEFDKAKGEALFDLERSKESTRVRARIAFNKAVFPEGHPYSELSIEDAQKELQAVSRDDLIAFHKAYYRPDTTIIVIAGDVKAAEAVELVKKYFGDWKAEGPAPVVDIPTIKPGGEAKKIVIPMTDKSEASVMFGHPMGLKRSDPDFYAARVMNQILGGSGALASILGKEIREKQGLVYSVHSAFSATLGAGPWYVSLGTNPKNVDKAVESVQTKIEEFRDKGATPEDFRRSLEFVIGVFPIALETNSGVANALLSAEFYGLGMDYLQNYAQIYRSVTLEQVNAAAKKYLQPDSATLVIAGPAEEN